MDCLDFADLRQHPPVTVPLPHPPTSASLHPFLRDRFIVGSTNDPWVRVYDLDSGQEREVYKGHHGPALCASYSPDGEVYASGSEDGESSVASSLKHVTKYTSHVTDN
jgi:serine-threonine kinase receptor-associated protein